MCIAKGIGLGLLRGLGRLGLHCPPPARPAPPRTASHRPRVAPRHLTQPPSPDPVRTHPPGRGPEGPAPTTVLATSRRVAWRATGSRGDSHRGGRQPALGNRSRTPTPPARLGGGELRAQAWPRVAILTPGSRCSRHLGVGRPASYLYWKPLWEASVKAGFEQPSVALPISSLLAARTAPVCGVNTFHFKRQKGRETCAQWRKGRNLGDRR